VSLEDRMNMLLERLCVPLRAVWLPSDNAEDHARIIPEKGLLMVYDKDESEAWVSFFHEILEFRLRCLLNPYRALVNKLIEFIDGQVYGEKEKVLDAVMRDFQMWREFEVKPSAPTNPKAKQSESVETAGN